MSWGDMWTGRRTLDGQVLDGATFSAAAVWWKTKTTDAASSPNPGTQDIVRVQVVSSLMDGQGTEEDRMRQGTEYYVMK